MILQCSHICKSFATDVVLDDVSFHINDNEKAAIVGVNGSGKSTLLKIIVGKSGSGESIIEEMQTAKPEVKILEKKMHELSDRMNSASGDELDSLIRQSHPICPDYHIFHSIPLYMSYRFHEHNLCIL